MTCSPVEPNSQEPQYSIGTEKTEDTVEPCGIDPVTEHCRRYNAEREDNAEAVIMRQGGQCSSKITAEFAGWRELTIEFETPRRSVTIALLSVWSVTVDVRTKVLPGRTGHADDLNSSKIRDLIHDSFARVAHQVVPDQFIIVVDDEV